MRTILIAAAVALGLAGHAAAPRAAVVAPGDLGAITTVPTRFDLDRTILGDLVHFDDHYMFEITDEFLARFPTPEIRVTLRQVVDDVAGIGIGRADYDVITGPDTAVFASVWGDLLIRTISIEINQLGMYTVRAASSTAGFTGGRYFGSILVTPLPIPASMLGCALALIAILSRRPFSIGRPRKLVDVGNDANER
jgi:hypothetical protein